METATLNRKNLKRMTYLAVGIFPLKPTAPAFDRLNNIPSLSTRLRRNIQSAGNIETERHGERRADFLPTVGSLGVDELGVRAGDV